MKTTLLILAAGMGSRYQGLKQIDTVGPNGEAIIDYSIYDAVRAGFERVVFVIRRNFEEAFREKIGSKLDGRAEIAYAFQELDRCVGDFSVPPTRQKPWGTAHAVLVTADLIDSPFAIINADDYYGPNSYKIMQQCLSDFSKINENSYAMVGFILGNTLSEHGQVSRGVCDVDEQMRLKKVVERTKIKKTDTGAAFTADDGSEHPLRGDEIVSMNLWGFHPSIFTHLRQKFSEFLKKSGNEEKSEFFIPFVVDEMINAGQASAQVLTTQDKWFGMTYSADKLVARERIKSLIAQGVYPQRLWEKHK